MPRTFLDGQAKWFPDGSLAELPDIDGDPDADVLGLGARAGRRRLLPHAHPPQRRRRDGPDRRRVLSLRFLGDDMVHAPRRWATSPPFPGLDERLAAGAALDDPLFPILWSREEQPDAAAAHHDEHREEEQPVVDL